MKAVVFHERGDIRLDEMPMPQILNPSDAIVRITASAICGTDLQIVRGTMSDVTPGTILGHEGVGIVEEVGPGVRNFKPGNRVVIASTIACGNCAYCRAGYYSQCDVANPNGPKAGTAFFGGPKSSGPFQGLQAEYARIPYANVGMFKLPDGITDDQAIALSDIFPTGYFAAALAEIKAGDIVAVFGCGPVGQFAIWSAKHLGAGRLIAIDSVESRLTAAQSQGAEIVNFDKESPVEAILALTGGIGVDRAIDAVGVDANSPHNGPAAEQAKKKRKQFELELSKVAPGLDPQIAKWHPGDAPSQALRWAVESLDKAGTLSIVGVYPEELLVFPIGSAMNKNLTINAGACNHHKYIPRLLELVSTEAIDPSEIVTQHEPMEWAIEAYQAFATRREGWTKVELRPTGADAVEAA